MKLQDLKAEDTIVLQNDKEAKKLRKLLEKEGYRHWKTGKKLNLKKARSSNCITVHEDKSFTYNHNSEGQIYSVLEFLKPKFKVICESEEQAELVKVFMEKGQDSNPSVKEDIDFSRAGQILTDTSVKFRLLVLTSGDHTGDYFYGTDLKSGLILWRHKEKFKIFTGKIELEN